MKRENTTTAKTRKRGRNRKNSKGGNGKLWIYNIRGDGTKGEREGRDKFNRGERKENGDVYNGVYRGDNKEKGTGGI